MIESFHGFLHGFFLLIVQADHMLFHLINTDLSNFALDTLMPFITNFHNTVYFIALIVAMWVFTEKMRAVKILLGIGITLLLSDGFADRVVKPLVHRQRPEFSMPKGEVRLLVPSQGSFAFPSNHATNCFAVATFVGTVIPGVRLTLWTVAAIIAFSRIYVGVHYPLDVFFGALFGIFWGATVFRFYGNQIQSQGAQWIKTQEKPRRGPRFGRRGP